MAQGGVIRQLLASLTSIELNRLHQTIDVAFQHDAIIDDGRYFIDHLGAAKLVFAIMAIPRSSVFQFFILFPFRLTANADDVVDQPHHRELWYGKMFERSICWVPRP